MEGLGAVPWIIEALGFRLFSYPSLTLEWTMRRGGSAMTRIALIQVGGLAVATVLGGCAGGGNGAAVKRSCLLRKE
jgi:hypothetical protein